MYADSDEEVLDHFAGFLRDSIDVLEETDCIHASREFETVENYLYVEKERFGNDLTVVYEIGDSDFDLPAFSVQTLVENAVLHGIRESETRKGTVRIKSYRTDTGHIVEVWDDGTGFPEQPDAERSEGNRRRAHIGLSNLQKRLLLMCGGRLEIEKETVVRMRIPMKAIRDMP